MELPLRDCGLGFLVQDIVLLFLVAWQQEQEEVNPERKINVKKQSKEVDIPCIADALSS